MLKQLSSIIFGIVLFILITITFSSIYIVDETKQVFVTQFGKIVRGPINGPEKTGENNEAGLYFRIPFIQEIHKFEKRYLEWDGDPNQVTTKDKLFIFIDTYARWRIVDAKLFFEKVQNEFGAQGRLDDILDGEAAKILGEQKRELKRITSEAYLQQQQIQGKADANAVAIYAEAFNQSAESKEFYEFLKTMETYENTLSEKDTLILSTGSDFFRFMKNSAPANK